MHLRRTGFTLVELLVALTLLGVGVAAWVGTSAVALRTAAQAERELTALRLARDVAEQLAAECHAPGSGERAGVRWTVTLAGAGILHVRVEPPVFPGAGAQAAADAEIAATCRS